MALGRLLARGVAAVVGLGVLAVMLVVGLPVLMLGAAALVGAVALLSAGLPAILVVVLVVIAVAAAIALIAGLFGIGVFVLKVVLFAMLLSWIFRKIFGQARRPEPALVGRPILDVAAPSRVRDKYEIAAERELDEELGL